MIIEKRLIVEHNGQEIQDNAYRFAFARMEQKAVVGSRRDELNNDERHGQTVGIYPSEAVSYSLASRELVWHKLRHRRLYGGDYLWGAPQSPVRKELNQHERTYPKHLYPHHTG